MKILPADVNSSNTWQIGTGDGTRSYHDIFLKFGVALVGPGDPGKDGDAATDLFYTVNPGVHNWGKALKLVQKGQWIIARKGTTAIVGLGQVEREYDYSWLFADVEGWDLQHYVSVRWYRPETRNGRIEFTDKVLGQSTLQRCRNQMVFDELYKTDFELCASEFSPQDFALPRQITTDDLANEMVDQGIRIQDAENVGATVERIIRLANWYVKNDCNALESEIVAFLILPLLVALGWSEQKMKLEYSDVDIALFKKAFRGDYGSKPAIILEAKTFGNGLAFTGHQIENYAQKFPQCDKFVATNGFRYKLFERIGSGLATAGYFNLLRLNERNVLYDIPFTSIQTILKISNFNWPDNVRPPQSTSWVGDVRGT
jgi:hypothetical protein